MAEKHQIIKCNLGIERVTIKASRKGDKPNFIIYFSRLGEG